MRLVNVVSVVIGVLGFVTKKVWKLVGKVMGWCKYWQSAKKLRTVYILRQVVEGSNLWAHGHFVMAWPLALTVFRNEQYECFFSDTNDDDNNNNDYCHYYYYHYYNMINIHKLCMGWFSSGHLAHWVLYFHSLVIMAKF